MRVGRIRCVREKSEDEVDCRGKFEKVAATDMLREPRFITHGPIWKICLGTKVSNEADDRV